MGNKKKRKKERKLTFQLDITVNNVISVEISDCIDNLGKDSLDQRRINPLHPHAGEFKEVTSRAVVKDQEGSFRVTSKGLQLDNGRMIDGFENLNFPVERDLNTLLVRSSSRPVLNDLDGHKTAGLGINCSVFLPGGKDNLAKGSLAQESLPAVSARLLGPN